MISITITTVIVLVVLLIKYKAKRRELHKLKVDYERMVNVYAGCLRRIRLYETALKNQGCEKTLEVAAEMEISEDEL
jgi:hypothetical protein